MELPLDVIIRSAIGSASFSNAHFGSADWMGRRRRNLRIQVIGAICRLQLEDPTIRTWIRLGLLQSCRYSFTSSFWLSGTTINEVRYYSRRRRD